MKMLLVRSAVFLLTLDATVLMAESFVTGRQPQHRCPASLSSSSSPLSDGEDSSSSSQPEDEFDVEDARRRLESLVSKDDNSKLKESEASTVKKTKPAKKPCKEDKATSLFNLSFLFPQQASDSEIQSDLQDTEEKAGEDDDMDLEEQYGLDFSDLKEPVQKILRDSMKVSLPITAMEIERRELEMELLNQLQYGDDTTDDLWAVWFQERGLPAAKKLMDVEKVMASTSMWDDAEKTLLSMIEEHGVSWVEPLNRLATLYYLQGRMEESAAICKVVLHYKPWHFGALSGIVMVYASLKDPVEAREWASLRLPTYSPDQDQSTNRRRQVMHQLIETTVFRLSRVLTFILSDIISSRMFCTRCGFKWPSKRQAISFRSKGKKQKRGGVLQTRLTVSQLLHPSSPMKILGNSSSSTKGP